MFFLRNGKGSETLAVIGSKWKGW